MEGCHLVFLMNKYLLFFLFMCVSGCAEVHNDTPRSKGSNFLICGPAITVYKAYDVGIKMCTTLDDNKEPNSAYIVIQSSLNMIEF
jgi:hypothetical protein